MSTFIDQLHQDLSLKLTVPSSLSDASVTSSSSSRVSEPSSQINDALRELFVVLDISFAHSDWQHRLQVVRELQQQNAFAPIVDSEQEALAVAVIAKVVTGLYLHALAQYLQQAQEADSDLEWWAELERSRWYSAYYLLQTLPWRVSSLATTFLDTIQARHIPLNASLLSPSSIRHLFPTRNILLPSALTISFFPHLHHQPYPVALLPTRTHLSHTVSSVRSLTSQSTVQLYLRRFWSFAESARHGLSSVIMRPLDLTANECAFKRERLKKIRDERATVLGGLLDVRKSVALVISAKTSTSCIAALQELYCDYENALQPASTRPQVASMEDGIRYLESIAFEVLPSQERYHRIELHNFSLHRPSKLTLLWPRLVFLPPVMFFGIRTAYASRASVEQLAKDAVETLQRFWQDWLLAPLRDVVQTVRAGSEEGVIVTKESVKADLDSLERMTLSLAQDKLHYTPEQMSALAQQIRLGDLTPVMQIYEDDIRSPLKSAIGGTLLRTLLVQVQKAKVDIDQALSGIDKLLKSQELTFAFVGVAPALAITYVTLGYLRSLWFGSKGKSRYGGGTHRAGVWAVVRRIERLLISSPVKSGTSTTVDPCTTGLLLLGTTQLRTYAEKHLPANSRIREGFLEDVKDLENPTFGRRDKLRVVDRMWNSWGDALGWRQVGAA